MVNANVAAGSQRLKLAMRNLRDQWLAVDPEWDDAVRRRFEERYLSPIEPAGEAAIIGLQKIAELLGKVRRDLTDRDESL
jgi:hypothetical protein